MTVDKGVPPILLVEDNQEDIDLTLYAFKKIKFSNPIEVCRDGEEAIKKMDDWGDTTQLPLCILLDINMPRINGLEVLARIKERFPSLPVIMLTSSQESVDVQKAYALGANSYIVKPVELNKFIEIARQISLYWVVLNQPPAGLP
jgi:CheY-like chemotaxis protein